MDTISIYKIGGSSPGICNNITYDTVHEDAVHKCNLGGVHNNHLNGNVLISVTSRTFAQTFISRYTSQYCLNSFSYRLTIIRAFYEYLTYFMRDFFMLFPFVFLSDNVGGIRDGKLPVIFLNKLFVR